MRTRMLGGVAGVRSNAGPMPMMVRRRLRLADQLMSASYRISCNNIAYSEPDYTTQQA